MHPDEINPSITDVVTPEPADDATGVAEAVKNITPGPGTPGITMALEVPAPPDQDDQQTPSPRVAMGKFNWLHRLIRKVQENFRSFKIRGSK